ncbi:FAS1-like dehydratase domain-containing protein [Brevibacillus marinus]|uniref:FAS1-like dehydratase domain-containing protein n=1 Tax=Brevibacillus marinus TaxID=2496837 RepID=UPI000F84BDD1|nr:MaoC family dehydratase N-terminal domain-containing protein [Brevibacillus marinus]
MSTIEQVSEYFQTLLGQRRECDLGEVTALTIRRYALAVGERNPLYFDREYAQKLGYADIIAPPNLLASIMEWGVGEAEEQLHRDGLSGEFLLPRHFSGIRVMGGGEEMTFYRPVVAGTHVTLLSEVTDTYTKPGSKGLIAFLVFTNTYRDQNGETLCVCKRTMIAR